MNKRFRETGLYLNVFERVADVYVKDYDANSPKERVPGQEMMEGTRMPPSERLDLAPRYGPALPPPE